MTGAGVEPSGEAGGRSSERPSYRNVAIVGGMTLLSRIVGVLREATRAHFLGTGPAGDAFQVAFQLPSILRRLVGEGAVSSALVPVFSESVRRDDPDEQRVFAEKFLTIWTLLVLVVTLAGVGLGAWFVSVAFRWGSFAEAAQNRLTGELTRILFWYLLLVGLAAGLQGILNARKMFAAPAAAPLLFNLAFVALAWAIAPGAEPGNRPYVLAAGVLAGGVLQLGVMVPQVWRSGIRVRPRWPLDHAGVRRVLRLFSFGVFGAGIYQINVLISTLIAGRLATGSVSALSFSSRLMEVVLGVFVFALGTVSLTSLSHQAADRDLAAFRSTFVEMTRWVIYITIPSTVGLLILRRPALSLILESGEFQERSLEMTARAFQFHALGLALIGLSRMLVNGFYALKDVRTPVRVAAVILVVNLVLAWVLSSGPLGHAGIAIAQSASVAVQVALLASVLGRRLPGWRWSDWARPLVGCGVGAAVMAVAVLAGAGWVEAATSKPALALRLGVVILAGAVTYFVATRAIGMSEAKALLGRAGRLLARRR